MVGLRRWWRAPPRDDMPRGAAAFVRHMTDEQVSILNVCNDVCEANGCGVECQLGVFWLQGGHGLP